MKRRIDTKAEEIEEAHGRKLTNRQKTFARHFVDATHSNAECARLAGYADTNGIAKIQAYKLLDSQLFSHVAEFIEELREDRERCSSRVYCKVACIISLLYYACCSCCCF